jgi:uncharacterized membrane protein YeaQ/YmgE (transglycosylase-associated protein family)
MLNVIGWIILGLISGFIASKLVNKTGSGLVMDVILGLVGAVVGGFIVRQFGFHGATGLNIPSLIVSVIGAVIVMVVFHFLFRRGRTI